MGSSCLGVGLVYGRVGPVEGTKTGTPDMVKYGENPGNGERFLMSTDMF